MGESAILLRGCYCPESDENIPTRQRQQGLLTAKLFLALFALKPSKENYALLSKFNLFEKFVNFAWSGLE